MAEKKVTPIPDAPAAGQIVPFQELTARVAAEFAIEPKALWDALKTEFFPGGAASDMQMFLALQIIDQCKLNPFRKEIYAAIGKKSGKLLIGIQYDGFITIAHRHPLYRGFKFIRERNPQTGEVTAITCQIFREDWNIPGEYTADMKEWFRKGEDTWETRPNHQLSVKAFNNAVKLTFGLTGVYDPEDIANIQEAESKSAIETTASKVIETPAHESQREAPGNPLEQGPAAAPGQTEASPQTPKTEAEVLAPLREAQITIVEHMAKEAQAKRTNDGAGVLVNAQRQEVVADKLEASSAPSNIREQLAKLIERTPPARVNLLLGQQGVANKDDLTDEQAALVVARLSKGAK
jgi:hypothetical protein